MISVPSWNPSHLAFQHQKASTLSCTGLHPAADTAIFTWHPTDWVPKPCSKHVAINFYRNTEQCNNGRTIGPCPWH
eukprot:3014561-Amphidinium_carterae.1